MSSKADLQKRAEERLDLFNVGGAKPSKDFDKKNELRKAKRKQEIDIQPERMAERKKLLLKITKKSKAGEPAQTRRMSFEITKDLYEEFEKYIAQEEAKGHKNIRSQEIRIALADYLAGKVEKDNGGD